MSKDNPHSTAREERPCERCGERTLNDRYCRDCDIEWCFAMALCRECKTGIYNPEFYGPIPEQHKPGCSLRDNPDYTAPTEVERWALWDAEQVRRAEVIIEKYEGGMVHKAIRIGRAAKSVKVPSARARDQERRAGAGEGWEG